MTKPNASASLPNGGSLTDQEHRYAKLWLSAANALSQINASTTPSTRSRTKAYGAEHPPSDERNSDVNVADPISEDSIADSLEYARLVVEAGGPQVSFDALVLRRRTIPCVRARRAAFVELRKRGWSLPRIGAAAGYHHTTVLHHLEADDT